MKWGQDYEKLDSATYNGVYVQWYLLVERGEWPKPFEQCDFGTYLHARGKLKEALDRKNKPWWGLRKHLAQLPLKEKLSLEQALAHVYTDALSMESVGAITLACESEPLTAQQAKWHDDNRREALRMHAEELKRQSYELTDQEGTVITIPLQTPL